MGTCAAHNRHRLQAQRGCEPQSPGLAQALPSVPSRPGLAHHCALTCLTLLRGTRNPASFVLLQIQRSFSTTQAITLGSQHN